MEYANAVIRINYVTLLLSGTLIKHGVNEVLTDKKEGANKKPLINIFIRGCGDYIFRGEETPIGSKMFKNKLGHDCRLAGSSLRDGIWYASIYVYDTKEFIEIEFNRIEKYL